MNALLILVMKARDTFARFSIAAQHRNGASFIKTYNDKISKGMKEVTHACT